MILICSLNLNISKIISVITSKKYIITDKIRGSNLNVIKKYKRIYSSRENRFSER